MGTNLQESADWYKLTKEIFDIKGNNILYEVPVDESSSLGHFTSDTGQAQGTNGTPSPPSDIRKERCPGYEVGFMTKY